MSFLLVIVNYLLNSLSLDAVPFLCHGADFVIPKTDQTLHQSYNDMSASYNLYHWAETMVLCTRVLTTQTLHTQLSTLGPKV